MAWTPNSQESRQINELVLWWQKVLHLQSWRITWSIVTENTLPRALMQVTPTRLRQIAHISIRDIVLARYHPTSVEFERLVVHELCHLLYDPLVEEHGLQIKYTDDARTLENKARFLRILEKSVEQTSLLLTGALHHELALKEVEEHLYKYLSGDQVTDVAELLTYLIKYVGDAIHAVSLDGRIASWNPAAETLYGYQKCEILGVHGDILVPTGEPRPSLHWQRILEKDGVITYEAKRLCKNGDILDLALTGFPIKNHNADKIGCAILSHLAVPRVCANCDVH